MKVEKTKKQLPKGLMVFDPEARPFQKEHTCVLLSELQEESEQAEDQGELPQVKDGKGTER